ncbi:acetate non-utilizing protein 9 [Cyanidiococcus yangmingshanensis]|uniref:Succinate dehydrogenase assembly factor 3 n=1 Tax=Cyanidiococcus yangmingshanensis TaxID=2690220 RepID=A0A7J7IIR6_9RHOD|nr:acetate non-utilizing protein 9 [Cyanidiococcus yangmingshanensis]
MNDAAWIEALRLYRCILRKHRQCLPWELRMLGDQYVAAEFRQMRAFWRQSSLEQSNRFYPEFLEQWRAYLERIATTGVAVDEPRLDIWQQVSDTQRKQLERLREVAIALREEETGPGQGADGEPRIKPPE